MWVTALNVSMLLLMLTALGYLAFAARKIEAGLDSLLHAQGERRHKLERELERVQLALESISTGVIPLEAPAKWRSRNR
jgi:hypothetical protein